MWGVGVGGACWGVGLVLHFLWSQARNQQCAANVSQTTAGHIGDHNWQHSSTGLIWVWRSTDWAVWVCVLTIAHVLTVIPVICSKLSAYTGHTHSTHIHARRDWNIDTSCWEPVYFVQQNAGKASSFNHSNLGLPGSVLANVFSAFDGLNA